MPEPTVSTHSFSRSDYIGAMLIGVGALSASFSVVSLLLSMTVDVFNWFVPLAGLNTSLLHYVDVAAYIFAGVCVLAAVRVSGLYILVSLIIMVLVGGVIWSILRFA